MNFQRIIDTISEALNFFDFSFIVSGSVTYGTVCYYLWRMGWLGMPDNTWLVIFASVILVYVCGLVSFISGKRIRMTLLKMGMTTGWKNKVGFLFGEGKDVEIFRQSYERIVTALVESGRRERLVKNVKDKSAEELARLEYTMMWGALRDCRECEKTVAFINRFWVMQAVCEGLLFSSVVIIVGGIFSLSYLLCGNGWDTDFFFQHILCMAAGIVGLKACYKEGRRYAESQIQEVVIAYYKHCRQKTPKVDSQ